MVEGLDCCVAKRKIPLNPPLQKGDFYDPVLCNTSLVKGQIPPHLLNFFSNQAMLTPRSFMLLMPSSSFSTSPGPQP